MADLTLRDTPVEELMDALSVARQEAAMAKEELNKAIEMSERDHGVITKELESLRAELAEARSILDTRIEIIAKQAAAAAVAKWAAAPEFVPASASASASSASSAAHSVATTTGIPPVTDDSPVTVQQQQQQGKWPSSSSTPVGQLGTHDLLNAPSQKQFVSVDAGVLVGNSGRSVHFPHNKLQVEEKQPRGVAVVDLFPRFCC
jgi:hypothetical protein